MKRRVIRRVERREPAREEFYEAVPAAPTQPVYREGPVYRDEPADDRLFSGWAIVGLIVLALVVLLLLFGRSGLNQTTNRASSGNTATAPAAAPTTSSPPATPTH